jgi:hypothetical protein
MASLLFRPASALSLLATGAVFGALIRPAIYISIGFAAGWYSYQQCNGDTAVLLSKVSEATQTGLQTAVTLVNNSSSSAPSSGPGERKK